MTRIVINFIDHEKQRYPTTGDWYEEKSGHWVIHVSKMADTRFMWLVAIHELVEMVLCQLFKIAEHNVDEWDRRYEETRKYKLTGCGFPSLGEGLWGPITHDSEPGDHPQCPYYTPHQFATAVERVVSCMLGVVWQEYEEANLALYK